MSATTKRVHRHRDTPGCIHADLSVSRHDALLQGKADISTLLEADINEMVSLRPRPRRWRRRRLGVI